MITLSLQLLLAHIIGDFLLQPASWVAHKTQKKHRSPYLYWHTLIHAVVLAILLRFDHDYLGGFLVIILSHLIIDLIKLHLSQRFNERILFFGDQVAHVAIILLVVNHYEPLNISAGAILQPKALLLITGILLVTVVSSIIMRVIITKWALEEDAYEDSLPHAGQYIGMLERLFVFGFIILQQWEVIGFLLAAKSVFRFGDLSKSKDRKLTEYILIGTLLSFGLAIVTGLAYNHLISLIR
ncbi:MAG: DUF3307 domain-containing protein [Marinoscillum sp.]|uniref:DUF3307 domain-containing protein n=1 Tax=Marinoscillum sp. TaxID=2024838 RepID=UPI0032F74496